MNGRMQELLKNETSIKVEIVTEEAGYGYCVARDRGNCSKMVLKENSVYKTEISESSESFQTVVKYELSDHSIENNKGLNKEGGYHSGVQLGNVNAYNAIGESRDVGDRWTRSSERDLGENQTCKTEIRGSLELGHVETKQEVIVQDATLEGSSGQNQSNYLMRMAKHGGDRKVYTCEYCDKKFDWLAKLRTHLVVHTDARHLCPICNKFFIQLRYHKIVHTNERPFKCKICPRQYRCRSALHLHLLSRHGGKPVKCPICDKKYTHNRSLNTHLKNMHPEEINFKCHLCERAFRHDGALSNHFNRVHLGDRPFQCSTCIKAFKVRPVLKAHGTLTGHRVCIDNYRNWRNEEFYRASKGF